MRVNPLCFATVALCLALCPVARGLDDITVFPPVLTNSVVKNPGKGWVVYSRNLPLERYSPRVLALASVAVWRWEWAEIEPAENVFNWRPIDDALAQCARYGLQCNFSVEAASSSSPRRFVTPKWVFDAGAKGIEIREPKRPHNQPIQTNQFIPVFDDPVYLSKTRAFMKSMAARYDGNPHIGFIDIRSYGNWGEVHMSPWSAVTNLHDISPEKFREHVQLHLDAFRRTPLCLPIGERIFTNVYQWAAGQGVWLRQDAVCGASDGHETRVCLGQTPAVFEGCAEYAQLKQAGWWNGQQTKPGVGYAFEDCIDHGCPTYAPLGQSPWDTPKLMQDEPDLVIQLSSRIGYHFVLRRAAMPTRFHANEPARMQLRWENIGVAPIYVPCVVGLGLIEESGRVASICWPEGSRPGNWKPGVPVNEEITVSFDSVPVGRYRLALGLFEHLGDIRPAFRLGNEMELVNGWHILAPVVMEVGER